MAVVIAPKPITTKILGIQFTKGEATIEVPALIEFFRSRHYKIIETAPPKKSKKAKENVELFTY